MSTAARSFFARYAMAIAVVAAAAALTRVLANYGDAGVSPLLFAAVLLAAWFGGLGPGLLATGLSGLATAWLLIPRSGPLVGIRDVLLRVLVFMIVALLASALHAAMRRARDAAQEASAAKSRFLAAVSHELRTPLNSILMIAESMQKNAELPHRTRDDAETIRRCVELEARLIDDLVDLSRLGNGKLSLSHEGLDVHCPLLEAIRLCEPDARERQLELSQDLRSTETRIVGDPVRLQQIFWNLIRNAIKFTPEGGRVMVSSFNSDRTKVSIQVTDTGIGIEPDRISSIFQAFEQGGPDITARFGGLGLGLAISQALAEAHGATIQATSAGAGRGATFTVSFPTVRESAANEGTIADRTVPAAMSPQSALPAENH